MTPSSTRYSVRDDLRAAHEKAWTHLAAPGTWWTGEERLQIASEARAARACTLCRARKNAVSPMAVQGEHTGDGKLNPGVVDVIHRVVTDPGRLTRSFVHGLFESGVLDDAPYVELVAVAVVTNALDVFERAVGNSPSALPEPVPGEPSRVPSELARDDGAWVRLVPDGEAGGEVARAIYQGLDQVPNIGRALSLVPAEVALLHQLSTPHYMSLDNVANPNYEMPGRALDRLQMELVASRVSLMNDCFY